jgi:hypothetical protein
MNANNYNRRYVIWLAIILFFGGLLSNHITFFGGKDKEVNESQSSDELLSSDTDISDNYTYLNNNNKENELLELEKHKQELELENQKIKLKQLQVKNNNIKQLENIESQKQTNQQERHNEIEDNFTTDKNNFQKDFQESGLCNDQKSFDEKQDYHLLNISDCNSDYFTLNDDYLSNNKEKIKPNELLPANTVDMKGESFLTTTLSASGQQIIGEATQTQRSRLNYDLRSTPPNPQIEVSPWNMSTFEPDTDRRHFEIGTAENEVAS